MQPKRMQSGFTLVEIAIVLVIIGLLLGGILKGQEMITQARIKNVVNDFNGITAAYFSYMDRYKAVPGDDPNAAGRWPGSPPAIPAGVNGGSDGQISGLYGAPSPATLPQANVNNAGGESFNFWWHLRLAGFVAGATSGQAAYTQPTNAVGGIVGVQTTAFTTLTGVVMCSANVPDKVASAVDTQVDDQRSNTGQMFGRAMQAGDTAATDVTALTADATYVETGSAQYVICKKI
jgi:prepilin-type N-terminal cleavage/methylation domain-containing protein